MLPYASEKSGSPAMSFLDFQNGGFVSISGSLFLMPVHKVSYLCEDIQGIWNNNNNKVSALCVLMEDDF